jgi:TDG/mug DNA glycosylase family protein
MQRTLTVPLKYEPGEVDGDEMARQPPAGASPPLHLPDKIPAELHTLFVGINPAVRSAQVGHYYAHPTNAFWRLVSQSGLTPRAVTTKDDDWMVQHGFGFTDVAKRPTANAGDLELQEFDAARERLAQLVIRLRPKTIIFVSKISARAFLQAGASQEIEYGRQAEPFHGATVWFLPSTSGQSNGHTTFEEKLAAFTLLAKHVSTYHTWEVQASQSTLSPGSRAWEKVRRLFHRDSPTS